METRPLRTLALYCPDWPVVASGAAADAPVAILDGEGPRQLVTACSPAARERGVRRGQRVREAQRRCPHLVVYRRDEAREARQFEPVAAAAEELAATSVEVVQPGLITVDVRGPARYYGGEARLATLIRDAVAGLTTTSGTPVRSSIGIADGSFAATLAAHAAAAQDSNGSSSDDGSTVGPAGAVVVEPGAAADFLAPYPVAVLDQPALVRSLTRFGVRTLGSFAALSVADVATRFGSEGVPAYRLARGLDPRPAAARRSTDALAVAHEFDPPAERDELVAFIGSALANRLHLALAMGGVACVRLGIDVVTASGRGCYRLWRHGDGIVGRLSAPAVAERIRWQLDGWRAREPYPVADPVVALRLVPDRLVVEREGRQVSRDSWDPQDADAWDARGPRGGGTTVPRRVERAIERVEGLLGPGAVQRPRLTGSRDGAAQVTTAPWGGSVLPDAPGATGATGPAGPAVGDDFALDGPTWLRAAQGFLGTAR